MTNGGTRSNAGDFWRQREHAEASNAEGSQAPAATTHPQPAWNNSTMTVRVLRDRMRELGWDAVGPVWDLPISGPATELDQRPLDLGAGLWR